MFLWHDSHIWSWVGTCLFVLRKILNAKQFQIIFILSLFCDSSEGFWMPGGSFVCWTGFGMLVFQLLFFPFLANFLGPILTTRIAAVGCWTFAWTTPLLLTLTSLYYANFGVVLRQWPTHLYHMLQQRSNDAHTLVCLVTRILCTQVKRAYLNLEQDSQYKFPDARLSSYGIVLINIIYYQF